MDKYLIFDNTFFSILISAGIPGIIHYIKVFSKKPYKNKLLPVIIFFFIITFNTIAGIFVSNNDHNKFVQAKVSSEVVKIRTMKNSRRYWLKNDMVMLLYSPYDIDLQVKDLIVKDSNSHTMKIYRKNSDNRLLLIGVSNY